MLRDPGAQAERTALAWSRTALAVLANAALVLRTGWVVDRAPVIALGFALLLGAAAVFRYSHKRKEQLLRSQCAQPPHPSDVITTALIALSTCGAGLASMLA
jgi:uncharacterized membrane protein YidH (DUF202 family)